MIVVDASVVVDLLLHIPPHAETIRQRLRREVPNLAAPHLLDAEVGQALRRYTLNGDLNPARADQALVDLAALPLVRYPHTALLRRAFDLRDNVSVYDALYVALAEAMQVPLL